MMDDRDVRRSSRALVEIRIVRTKTGSAGEQVLKNRPLEPIVAPPSTAEAAAVVRAT